MGVREYLTNALLGFGVAALGNMFCNIPPDGDAAASVSAAWSGWSRRIRAGRCEPLTMLKSSSRGSFSDVMKALAVRYAKWELASCGLMTA